MHHSIHSWGQFSIPGMCTAQPIIFSHQGLYILSRGYKEEGSLSIHLGSSLSSKHGCLLRFVVVVTAQIFPKPKFPVSHASLTFTSPCSSDLWLILSVFNFCPLNSILPIDIASWF